MLKNDPWNTRPELDFEEGGGGATGFALTAGAVAAAIKGAVGEERSVAAVAAVSDCCLAVLHATVVVRVVLTSRSGITTSSMGSCSLFRSLELLELVHLESARVTMELDVEVGESLLLLPPPPVASIMSFEGPVLLVASVST